MTPWTARFHDFFRSDVRVRGAQYARAGAVRFVEGTDDVVVAKVAGEEIYEVRLRHHDHTLFVSCTCRYVVRYLEPCKHIWAAMLSVESRPALLRDFEPLEIALASAPEARRREPREPGSPSARGIPSSPGVLRDGTPAPAASRESTSTWRRQLEAFRESYATREHDPEGASAETFEIRYHIDAAASERSNRLFLEVTPRHRTASGKWSKARPRRMTTFDIPSLPDELDRRILSVLSGAHDEPYNFSTGYEHPRPVASRYSVSPELAPLVVELACRTGRCGYKPLAKTAYSREILEFDRPLAWDGGEPWELSFRVDPGEAGSSYRIVASLVRGEERVPVAGTVRLALRDLVFMEDRVARLARTAPSWLRLAMSATQVLVPRHEGLEFAGELFSTGELPHMELPNELVFEEIRVVPRPRIHVLSASRRGRVSELGARVSFDYGDHVIVHPDPKRMIVLPERRRAIHRDEETERVALERLRALGFRPAGYWMREDASFEIPAKKLPRAVTELLSDGWTVQADGKHYRQPGTVSLGVRSTIDWFELEGSVDYGGVSAPLPALLSALRRGEGFVVLGDGSYGVLPEEWLKRHGMVTAAGRLEGETIRFARSQVGLLDALLAAQPEATFDETFAKARAQLSHFHGIEPMEAPPEFRGTLRPYQREGLGWLEFLRRFGFGGCLADDMGLGKTVQVLALLATRRCARSRGEPHAPSLVVVPKSLVFNWKEEAERFTPELRVLDHTGAVRKRALDHFHEFDLVITTYGTLRRDAHAFKDLTFEFVILDEAQAVKNASTESSKAVRLLRGNHRLALSGTPIENHLGELWTLFEFLNPGMLGSSSAFRLAGAGTRESGADSRELLAKALRPFILRRTKAQVAKDLPPKLEQTIYCELDRSQRALYDELKEHYRRSLLRRVARDGMNKSQIQILEALLRLRQAACHPGLLDAERVREPSAKLDILIPQLDEVMEEGHKALVFSQFTSFLDILRKRLDAGGVSYEYLDGQTRDRRARVERFQTDPECRLFLVSLKAGGLGLNLTAAEYVFLLDPWWNPAVEAQAIDRAHRIGQTRHVFAYRLIARDTVEEKVLSLQQTKRDLADAIIRAEKSLLRGLAREDLELLLS